MTTESTPHRVRRTLRTVYFGPRGSSLLRAVGQGVVTVTLTAAALGTVLPQPARPTSSVAQAPATVAPTVEETTAPPVAAFVPPVVTAAPTTPAPRPTTAKPVVRATTTAPKPSPAPTRKPTPKPVALSTCGAPPNPWGYNFCGRGSFIDDPAGGFCDVFDCIPSFWENTNGYVMQCDDGMYSHSGGVQGSCSHHGGNNRPLYG